MLHKYLFPGLDSGKRPGAAQGKSVFRQHNCLSFDARAYSGTMVDFKSNVCYK